MPRRQKKKEIDFTLKQRDYKNAGTAKPRPTADTQRPYVQPKPQFIGGRYVLRSKKFVQLETQYPVRGTIQRIVILQGESSTNVFLHFDDGSVQQL